VGTHFDEGCLRSPYYYAFDSWEDAKREARESELKEFGPVHAPGVPLNTILVAALYDTSRLFAPLQFPHLEAAMGVALVREGLLSQESMGHLSQELKDFPQEVPNLNEAQMMANETLTAFGVAHAADAPTFERRVQAMRNVVTRVHELGIKRYLDPLGVATQEPEIDDEGLDVVLGGFGSPEWEEEELARLDSAEVEEEPDLSEIEFP
jgi:hypothetical protein